MDRAQLRTSRGLSFDDNSAKLAEIVVQCIRVCLLTVTNFDDLRAPHTSSSITKLTANYKQKNTKTPKTVTEEKNGLYSETKRDRWPPS